MIAYRAAAPADLKPILDLLRSHELDLSGVRESLGHFVVAHEGDQLVASIGLEVHPPFALLRSAAVVPTRQGAGLGAELVGRAVERARAEGIRELYLFTTGAAPFFERHGFVPIDRAAMPEALKATDQSTHACGATAVAMRRVL